MSDTANVLSPTTEKLTAKHLLLDSSRVPCTYNQIYNQITNMWL